MLNIQEDMPLSKHTTFRIGGPARFFVEAKSEEELIEALKYARDNKLEFFVLGGGSNLLVSDKGFDGIVIKIKDTRHKIQDESIECGAGVPLAKVIRESINNNLIGMEWAAGIPGTVGGAVYGNAGAYDGETGNVADSVKVLNREEIFSIKRENQKAIGQMADKIKNDNFKFKILKNKECEFSYRSSIFKQNKNLIILSAIFKLKKGNKEESEKKFKEIISARIAKQPKGASAGSFFINPVVVDEKLIKEFEGETGKKSKNRKLPAPWLIEKVDLKGKKIGDAMVSEEHANYIVNTGAATSEDVIILSSLIKQQVRDKFGIQLKEEVQYLGF